MRLARAAIVPLLYLNQRRRLILFITLHKVGLVIIFTEHDEVIVGLKDFRNLIRWSAELARRAAFDNVPNSFMVESVLREIEAAVKDNPHSMEVLP